MGKIKGPPRKAGRPSLYTHALGVEIARRMAEGETVIEIARTANYPSHGTIFAWGTDQSHPFSEMYARARQLYAHKVAAEIVELADAGEARMANVELLRVRIDARKWAASKLMPKDYGDRVQQDVNAKVELIDADALDSRLDRAIAAHCAGSGAGEPQQD